MADITANNVYVERQLIGECEEAPDVPEDVRCVQMTTHTSSQSLMTYFSIFSPKNAYSAIVDEEAEAPLHSLSEFYGTVYVPHPDQNAPWYKTLFSFVGPGLMVAVGYMDPGNWSTDIAGGSAFGYKLLVVIAISSMMAMLLQYLALKVGMATSKDLAQLCRDSYSKSVVCVLWIAMEIAICATGK